MKNPFEEYDIDPMLGPAGITERMRELTEDADEEARDGLRAVWEELTMHPRRRLQIALEAFPEARPSPTVGPPRVALPARVEPSPLSLVTLVTLPSVAAALCSSARQAPSGRPAPQPPSEDVLGDIQHDPFLQPTPGAS